MLVSFFLAGAAVSATGAAAKDTHSKSYMAMNPEHVATLLRDTQQEWVDFAMHEKPDVAAKNMEDSCAVVAQGMVDGSDGDKDRVEEYFREVCTVGKQGRAPTQQDNCNNFAQGLLSFMTNDAEANRNGLNARGFCAKFWQQHMSSYVEAAEARRAAEAEAQRREHEEMIAQQKRSAELAKEKAMAEAKRQDAIRLANVERAMQAQHAKDAGAAVQKTEKAPAAAAETAAATTTKVATDKKADALSAKLEETAKILNGAKGDAASKKVEKKSADAAAPQPASSSPSSTAQSLRDMASDKLKNLVSYFTSHMNGEQTKSKAAQSGKTMADAFRKESTHLLHASHHAGAIKANKRTAKINAAVLKTDSAASDSTESVKAAAKAVVADKVKAIKERIAKKFEEKKHSSAKEGNLRK